jgi:dihydrodipicolinate synthase/N-acetylneuraminate lyase
VARIIDFLVAGGVHGVFVLGTTGEAPSVPAAMRNRIVEMAVASAGRRIRVYAGISDNSLTDSVDAGNQYLKLGVDALVAHVPSYFSVNPEDSLIYFNELSDRLHGDLILYNMPITTNVSIPIHVCKQTSTRRGVIGIKDSENNADRMAELLRELGGREKYSVFVGTGPLMAKGLLQGADGIVPSAGNLVPGLCRKMYDCATNGGRDKVESLHQQFMKISGVYQQGRSLPQSLAALKGAMTWLGLCGPDVFPPLKPTTATQRLAMRTDLLELGVPVKDIHDHANQTSHRANHGRPGGHRPGAVPADAV